MIKQALVAQFGQEISGVAEGRAIAVGLQEAPSQMQRKRKIAHLSGDGIKV